MEISTKDRWNLAIRLENAGWEFANRSVFERHEAGGRHGQITYAKYMMLFEDFGVKNAEENKFNYDQPIFDLQGKSVVDVCGGPNSLILRCFNFKKAIIVDPGEFPDYITNRYTKHGIEIAKVPAEEFEYNEKVNEVWFYNALQHVYNPYIILENAKNNSGTIRIMEAVNCGTDIQHPQNLTAEEFEKVLGIKGQVIEPNDPSPSPGGLHFLGVFHF